MDTAQIYTVQRYICHWETMP